MRKTLLATAILVNALALGGTAAMPTPMTNPATTVPQAPIGHLQPGPSRFRRARPAEQAEQQQMSAYDAEQQKLDEQLDQRLNICRGC